MRKKEGGRKEEEVEEAVTRAMMILEPNRGVPLTFSASQGPLAESSCLLPVFPRGDTASSPSLHRGTSRGSLSFIATVP